jgi:hypothetical protein
LDRPASASLHVCHFCDYCRFFCWFFFEYGRVVHAPEHDALAQDSCFSAYGGAFAIRFNEREERRVSVLCFEAAMIGESSVNTQVSSFGYRFGSRPLRAHLQRTERSCQND